MTFNGEPTVEATNRENLNVLRSFPFSSATVMDDPREPDEVAADPGEVDTIRSVVIEFECSGGRKTCVDVKDVSQTGGATVDVGVCGMGCRKDSSTGSKFFASSGNGAQTPTARISLAE